MATFEEVANKFRKLANDLDGAGLEKITTRVATLGKGDVLKEVENDVGSDRKMSGWRPKFNARYDLTGPGVATIRAVPPGPWKVLEDGRRNGVTLPKRKRRKVYRTPRGLRTATKEKPFTLGGTTGKGTFRKAQTVIARKTPDRIRDETNKLLKSYW